jgi:hypothetical protein
VTGSGGFRNRLISKVRQFFMWLSSSVTLNTLIMSVMIALVKSSSLTFLSFSFLIIHWSTFISHILIHNPDLTSCILSWLQCYIPTGVTLWKVSEHLCKFIKSKETFCVHSEVKICLNFRPFQSNKSHPMNIQTKVLSFFLHLWYDDMRLSKYEACKTFLERVIYGQNWCFVNKSAKACNGSFLWHLKHITPKHGFSIKVIVFFWNPLVEKSSKLLGLNLIIKIGGAELPLNCIYEYMKL